MILVRDWSLEPSLVGFEGGAVHLRGKLGSELRSASGDAAQRVDILDAFETSKCFLLRHPGEKIAGCGSESAIKVKGKQSNNPACMELELNTFILISCCPQYLLRKLVDLRNKKCFVAQCKYRWQQIIANQIIIAFDD